MQRTGLQPRVPHLRQGLHRALAALLELAVPRVVLESRVIRLQRLLMLLHEVLQVALAAVALCKIWCEPDALVCILQCALSTGFINPHPTLVQTLTSVSFLNTTAKTLAAVVTCGLTMAARCCVTGHEGKAGRCHALNSRGQETKTKPTPESRARSHG